MSIVAIVMVNFGTYWQSMVEAKPEWRNAYIDYPMLNAMLKKLKTELEARAVDDGGVTGDLFPVPVLPETQEEDDFDVFAQGRVGRSPLPPRERSPPQFPPTASASIPINNPSFQQQHRSPLVSSHPATALDTLHGRPSREIPLTGQSLDTHQPQPETGGSMHHVGSIQQGILIASPSMDLDGTVSQSRKNRVAFKPPMRKTSEMDSPSAMRREMSVDAQGSDPSVSHMQPTPEPPVNVRQPLLNPFPTQSAPSQPRFGVEYLLSLTGRSIAQQFEARLLAETAKCGRWATRALESFDTYFNESQESWGSGRNVKKSKFAIRHLYEEINYLHTFCDTNILTIKTALKKYGHAQPEAFGPNMDESLLSAELFALCTQVDALRLSIEVFFSKTFVGGDNMMKGIQQIRDGMGTPMISANQAFRAGFFVASIVGLILYWAHVYYELEPSPEATRHMSDIMPVFRLVLALPWAFLCWSWVLRICAVQRINYLYVFEFAQTTTMTWMVCLEYALCLLFFVLACGILFVRFEMERHFIGSSNWDWMAPYLMPIFITILVTSIAIPPRHVIRNARATFFRVLWKISHLPWGYVRFVEFFVADWGTSLVIPCMDLVYTACFYTAGSDYAFRNSDTWHDCTTVTNRYQWPVEALPYFWRACQTMKMFLGTKNKAHLVNHGKYQSFIIYFAVSWVFAFYPDVFAWRVIVEFWHFAAEVYAFVWDVLMDWGFIRGRARQRMFKRTWIYVAAAIFDFAARFFYLPAELWIKPRVDPGWLLLFQANLEIFRRANWSIFRIENENVNNLETYRSIDFVPEVSLPDNSR